MPADIDRGPRSSRRQVAGRRLRPTASLVAVKLYKPGTTHADQLVKERKVVRDDRGAWSEHQPSAAEENKYIEDHGLDAYGRWHLAVDDEIGPEAKGRYKFPYGDFVNVHRCAVLAAESRAGQRKYTDVELAAAHLHGMLEA